jgi:hypothetical protein
MAQNSQNSSEFLRTAQNKPRTIEMDNRDSSEQLKNSSEQLKTTRTTQNSSELKERLGTTTQQQAARQRNNKNNKNNKNKNN